MCFAVWAQCTNVSNNHTHHGTVTSIAIGEIACQRCRPKTEMKWKKYKYALAAKTCTIQDVLQLLLLFFTARRVKDWQVHNYWSATAPELFFFVFRSSGLHFIAFHGEIHSRDVRPLVRPRCNYIICDWLWHIPSSLHTVAQELTTKADSDLSVIYKCCFATSDIYPINSHYWAFPDTSRFSPALQCWFLADRRLLSMVALMLIWSNSESVKSAIYAQVFKIVLSFWKFAYE